MKIINTISMLLLAVVLITSGCSSNGGDSDTKKVQLSYYSAGEHEADKEATDKLIEEFEENNPEIEIDPHYPAEEYEDQLRVKMAANDMPDLFDTHGWAKIRYSEYIEDLSDMDWTSDLAPELEDVLTDDEGKVYAFPLNQAKDGLTYNASLLDEYDVEPPETFDEFIKALETIKEKSDGEVTPLWFAGGDQHDLALYFDLFSSPLLITEEDNNYEEELLDGSFDWSNYTFLPKKLKEMQENDLLNEDVVTAQLHEQTQRIAQGEVAFIVRTMPAERVLDINPDAEVGIMPIPAIHEGDEPTWIGGERYTMALWKDSEHKEEAKKFIEFLAKPENVKYLAESTNQPAGLANTDTELYYGDYYDEYSDVGVEPFFDRVYLPSGMYDVMGKTAQELLSGSMTPEEVSKEMEAEYNRLRE